MMYPVSGGFYSYAVRFVDPSFGFATAWTYVISWATALPLELTVCAITIGYWDSNTSTGVWIAVFLAAIIILNIFGVLGYAEEEFWASSFKLVSVLVFIIIAVVLVCGGGPSNGRYHRYWGARFWYDPGAFKTALKDSALFSSQVSSGYCGIRTGLNPRPWSIAAAFTFAGTELVGLAAAETRNPTVSVPSAVKQVFWRITIFYILALSLIGLLINSRSGAFIVRYF